MNTNVRNESDYVMLSLLTSCKFIMNSHQNIFYTLCFLFVSLSFHSIRVFSLSLWRSIAFWLSFASHLTSSHYLFSSSFLCSFFLDYARFYAEKLSPAVYILQTHHLKQRLATQVTDLKNGKHTKAMKKNVYDIKESLLVHSENLL